MILSATGSGLMTSVQQGQECSEVRTADPQRHRVRTDDPQCRKVRSAARSKLLTLSAARSQIMTLSAARSQLMTLEALIIVWKKARERANQLTGSSKFLKPLRKTVGAE